MASPRDQGQRQDDGRSRARIALEQELPDAGDPEDLLDEDRAGRPAGDEEPEQRQQRNARLHEAVRGDVAQRRDAARPALRARAFAGVLDEARCA